MILIDRRHLYPGDLVGPMDFNAGVRLKQHPSGHIGAGPIPCRPDHASGRFGRESPVHNRNRNAIRLARALIIDAGYRVGPGMSERTNQWGIDGCDGVRHPIDQHPNFTIGGPTWISCQLEGIILPDDYILRRKQVQRYPGNVMRAHNRTALERSHKKCWSCGGEWNIRIPPAQNTILHHPRGATRSDCHHIQMPRSAFNADRRHHTHGGRRIPNTLSQNGRFYPILDAIAIGIRATQLLKPDVLDFQGKPRMHILPE